MKSAPTFPPLLTGHKIASDKNLLKHAQKKLSKNEIGAGDLLWSDNENTLSFALVLEPEVAHARCGEMLYLLMVAFGDAAGAISAPEIVITYRWPCQILVNEAVVGDVDLILSNSSDRQSPDWLIACLNISIMPEVAQLNPGEEIDRTTLWDEGCGFINSTELLESVSRHVVNWLHTWEEDGFKPVHKQWMGRLSEKRKLSDAFHDDYEFVGLDESGNALVKKQGAVTTLHTLDVVGLNTTKSGAE